MFPLFIRSAWRTLAATPRLAIVAIVSIAFGVWGMTAIFLVLNGIAYRPLPVGEADRLVRVGATRSGSGFYAFSYPDYVDLRDGTRSLEGLVAHQPIQVSWRRQNEARVEWAEIVSGNYFEVLKVPMTVGRGFAREEDLLGGPPAVVVGERFWRAHLNADPSAIGHSIRINGHPFTIVGVAGPDFAGTFASFVIQLWVPLGSQPLAMPETGDRLDRRNATFLMLIGRLRPGETPTHAAADLRPIVERFRTLAPDSHRNVGVAVAPASGVHPFIQNLLPRFLALLGAAVLVLLAVACANVAGLLLARALERRREMATRAALGASRWRLVRQLLGEAVLLAVVGGALGLLLSVWTASAMRQWRPTQTVPLVLPVTIDVRVVAFAIVVTGLTAILFGVAPALRGSRIDLTRALRLDSSSADRQRARRVLVTLQLALSVLLLTPALLLVRGLLNVSSIDLRFDPRGVYTTAIEPRFAGLNEAQTRYFETELQRRLSTVPGVAATSYALFVMLGDRGDELPIRSDVRPDAPTRSMPYNIVSPEYFGMLGIRLLRGRLFTPADDARAPHVVVVDENAARAMWPGREAVGQTIALRDDTRLWQVIGVVAHTPVRSYSDPDERLIYLPSAQAYRPDMILHVKMTGGSAAAIQSVRETIARMNPDVPATPLAPMTEEMAWALVPTRVAATVLGASGGLALALALIGLYALLSYGVTQRRREIAIRVALGATPRDIRRLIAGDIRRLSVIAIVAGLSMAAGSAQLMRALLIGVTPLDPFSASGALAIVLGVIWLALRVPTRGALHIDPADALRAE